MTRHFYRSSATGNHSEARLETLLWGGSTRSSRKIMKLYNRVHRWLCNFHPRRKCGEQTYMGAVALQGGPLFFFSYFEEATKEPKEASTKSAPNGWASLHKRPFPPPCTPLFPHSFITYSSHSFICSLVSLLLPQLWLQCNNSSTRRSTPAFCNSAPCQYNLRYSSGFPTLGYFSSRKLSAEIQLIFFSKITFTLVILI